MLQRKWVCTGLCVIGALFFASSILVLYRSSIWPTLEGQPPFHLSEGVNCPTIAPIENITSPYSLYYTRFDEAEGRRLWVLRDGAVQETAYNPAPYGLRISPDGTRFVHISPPTAFGIDESEVGILIADLPISANGDVSGARRTDYLDAWYRYRGFGGWLDSQTIYFDVGTEEGIRTIILDTDNFTYRELAWERLDDQWERGRRFYSDDLAYFVYPSNQVSEGVPNRRTAEAVLYLVAASDPEHRQRLEIGDIWSVRWLPGSHDLVFESSAWVWYPWYRINADVGIRDESGSDWFSPFHEGVSAPLYTPSLSPDGHLLVAQAYLPNEQQSTLLILPEGEETTIDLCLHSDYGNTMQRGAPSVAVWSPDSRYFAFTVESGEPRGLYVYDTQNHTISLVDSLESGDHRIEIMGWGY